MASPLPKRLKAVRLKLDLSQADFGVRAGIDPSAASPRMNQYEKGIHTPSYSTAKQLMQAAGLPVAYLYAEDDQLADLIIMFSKLDPQNKHLLLQYAGTLAQD